MVTLSVLLASSITISRISSLVIVLADDSFVCLLVSHALQYYFPFLTVL